MLIMLFSLSSWTFSQAQENGDVKELLDKVKQLENQVQDLREEADVRNKLKITREEEQQKEEEILTAVDREEYTLTKKKSINLTYTLGYSYSSYDKLQLDESDIFGEHLYNHSINHNISVSYGLLNNLSVSFGVPFKYRYYQTGGNESRDVTDIGDMSLGVGFRPFKSAGWMPTMSFHGSATLPTGRSPYKIDPMTELSTGSGVYSLGAGVSMSKPIDPIVAFGSLSYTYSFPKSDFTQNVNGLILEKVEPGPDLGFKIGLGYALSYRTSINLSFNYTHGFSSTYYYKGGYSRETAVGTSAGFSVGTGWKISPTTTISLGVGIGLVGDENFSLSFSVPFEF